MMPTGEVRGGGEGYGEVFKNQSEKYDENNRAETEHFLRLCN